MATKSLGNHEFDEGVSGLKPFINNLTTPVLAANLLLQNVPELKDEKNLQNSVILVQNGVKIGVIGYLTPETKTLAPVNDVEYEEEIIAIRREVNKLKNEGVQILIALGHSGFIKDLEIAKNVEDIDVVVGGHSNTFLWNGVSTEMPEKREGSYPAVVLQPSGRKVLVVQAYAYTKYMGKLHLIFNNAGEIEEYDGTPILLDQHVPKDPELEDLVTTYHNDIDAFSAEIVGSSLTLLDGSQCRVKECNIGNIITDAMLNYTKRYYNDNYPNVNIAICQSGRIRASIDRPEKPFNMTKGDWISVLPFSDTLSVLTVNGSTLREVLEHSVAAWRLIDSSGQFLQFSGMEVTYDLSKPPGARIVKALASCSNCGKTKPSEIKDLYEYKIIMPEFIAEGGDGFSMFVKLKQDHLPYAELECIYDYLKRNVTINPQISQRITLLNKDKAVQPVKFDEKGRFMPSMAMGVKSNIFIVCCTFIASKLFLHR